MALRHYAYSFDVDGFMKSTSPLVESVDNGDLRPLFEMTTKTIRNGFEGYWPLEEAGSHLPSVVADRGIGVLYYWHGKSTDLRSTVE